MGVALAEECYLHGADVLLLRAKNAVEPRYSMQEETFETTEDLSRLVKEYISAYDVIYHTAAVSDFTVQKQVKVLTNIDLISYIRTRCP